MNAAPVLGEMVGQTFLSAGAGRQECLPHHNFRVVVFALALLHSFSAHAATIPLGEYRAKLTAIAGAIDRGSLSDAQRAARELSGAKISAPAGDFDADASLLAPIVTATQLAAAQKLKPRVNALLVALPDDAARPQPERAESADASALERFRRDEAVDAPKPDGEISGGEILESDLYKAIKQALFDFVDWADKILSRVYRWLRSLFTSITPSAGPGGFSNTFFTVAAVLVAVAALILVVWVLRKNDTWRPALPAKLDSGPKQSSKDADPTSRDAAQWEEYAASLAASGRHREAIRACYHAILAGLFGAGILHYRRGRTNWEYCYALPPDVPWRERFFDLTGFFEIEWYGKFTSAPEDFRSYSAATRQFMAQARGKTGGAP